MMDINRLKHLDELEKLGLPKEQYVIIGSAPLVIRGLKESNGDIDIAVTEELWAELCRTHKPCSKTVNGKERLLISIGNIDIGDCAPYGTGDPESIIRNADILGGHRFLTLADTRRWKAQMGRKKDFEDIAKIDKYLANGGD